MQVRNMLTFVRVFQESLGCFFASSWKMVVLRLLLVYDLGGGSTGPHVECARLQIGWSGLEHRLRTLCCVLGQDT